MIREKLIFHRDGSFEYMICNDVAPLQVFDGSWKFRSQHLYFFNALKNTVAEKSGLQLLGEKTEYDSTLGAEIKRVAVLEIDGDTTQFAGVSIIDQAGTYVLGVDKPVNLVRSSQIEIDFLGSHFHYLLNKGPKVNVYKIFVRYVVNDNIPRLTKMPFDTLKYSEGVLMDSLGRWSFEVER